MTCKKKAAAEIRDGVYLAGPRREVIWVNAWLLLAAVARTHNIYHDVMLQSINLPRMQLCQPAAGAEAKMCILSRPLPESEEEHLAKKKKV